MLESDITGTFDYVAVEVIENPGLKVTDIECGLFMGIITHSSATNKEAHFLALQTAESSVRLYNMNEFNVLSLEALDADMNYLTVFRNTAQDQEQAAGVLRAFVKAMGESWRLFDSTPNCELIDVDSYTNVPSHILTGNTLTGSTEGTTYKRSNATYINDTTYTRREPAKPTVLHFKRKGKLPSEERLTKMKSMVLALSTGELDLGKFPFPKCDVVEEPAEETATQTSV